MSGHQRDSVQSVYPGLLTPFYPYTFFSFLQAGSRLTKRHKEIRELYLYDQVKKTDPMDTTIKKVELTLPEVDMALLKQLAKKFG